ncbi:MAG: aspartyl/glutamyl-tRNA amidotransferase subunit B [Cycloclasticus sp. symbiont of Poecilosclerida sp. N]|nr:MAG: aspartyl/glutamyl-tRNA amidotransferase subunit B [Cycloclasticus sp. symbiont of Poecilosclerida sp. N]
MQWETVIGLEIHVQLATKSKIFSGASTAYGAQPNTQACAVDLGLPGTLPVLNEQAVRFAVRFGLAIGAHIAPYCVFARKNYFYPDLPKGYQTSQFDKPIVGLGNINIVVDGETKTIGVTRAHLEEDAGKSLHEDYQGKTGVDLNRAGTPLLEIVSEPDMRSSVEAVAYVKKMHTLVQYLGICDGNMQEGSFRCDVNVSVRPVGQKELGTRAEIKNLNSFRFIEKAIAHEVERQIDVIESGGSVVQETRLYDADKNETRSMRSKEEANDYRYFPCPDLLPVEITSELLDETRATLPELPEAKKQRFQTQYKLNEYDCDVLTTQRAMADYYEDAVSYSNGETKLVANWVMGELSAFLKQHTLNISASPVTAERLGGLVNRIADQTISGKIAKQVFEHLSTSDATVDEIIEREGLMQISDSGELEKIIDQLMVNNEAQVEQFRAGKTKVLGFFVGSIMKQTQGKANPQQVNKLLQEKLKG